MRRSRAPALVDDDPENLLAAGPRRHTCLFARQHKPFLGDDLAQEDLQIPLTPRRSQNPPEKVMLSSA